MSLPTPYYAHAGVTIFHGDVLDVLPALSGIGAVVTDPPYSSGGVFRGDRTAKTLTKYISTDSSGQHSLTDFGGDTRDQRGYFAWSALWMTGAFHASIPGAVIASFIDWRQLPVLTDAFQSGGWVWRGVAAWSKKFGRPRAGGFSNACEFVTWGSKGGLIEHESYPPGIFEFSPISTEEKQHIAEKPLPVMGWILRAVPPGAVVLDPFMGSGTTLQAAKNTGHAVIGIDADERCCETAAKRLGQEVLFGAEAQP